MSSETGKPPISEEAMRTTKYEVDSSTAKEEEQKAEEKKEENKEPEQPQEEIPTDEIESEGAGSDKSFTEEERKAMRAKEKDRRFNAWVVGWLRKAFTGGKTKAKA